MMISAEFESKLHPSSEARWPMHHFKEVVMSIPRRSEPIRLRGEDEPVCCCVDAPMVLVRSTECWRNAIAEMRRSLSSLHAGFVEEERVSKGRLSSRHHRSSSTSMNVCLPLSQSVNSAYGQALRHHELDAWTEWSNGRLQNLSH